MKDKALEEQERESLSPKEPLGQTSRLYYGLTESQFHELLAHFEARPLKEAIRPYSILQSHVKINVNGSEGQG